MSRNDMPIIYYTYISFYFLYNNSLYNMYKNLYDKNKY